MQSVRLGSLAAGSWQFNPVPDRRQLIFVHVASSLNWGLICFEPGQGLASQAPHLFSDSYRLEARVPRAPHHRQALAETRSLASFLLCLCEKAAGAVTSESSCKPKATRDARLPFEAPCSCLVVTLAVPLLAVHVCVCVRVRACGWGVCAV